VAHRLFSYVSAHGIIQDRFEFHKVCARRISKQRTRDHKRKRLTICQGLFYRYHKGDDVSLDALSLGMRLRSRKQTPDNGMETSDPDSQKFNQPSAEKVVLTIF
jgi:hypothetical protein